MPFTGNTFDYAVNPFTSNGVLSDADTQHFQPLTEIKNALSTLKGGIGGQGAKIATSTAAIAALDPDATAYAELDNSANSTDNRAFAWRVGDFTAAAASDPAQARVIASTLPAKPLTVGAWVKRTDRPLTPYMFGVVDDTPTVSQHVALQRFWDALANEFHPWVDQSCRAHVTTGFKFGDGTNAIVTRETAGRMDISTILGGAPEQAARIANPTMFEVRGGPSVSDNITLGEFFLYGNGIRSGGSDYADRVLGFFNAMDVTGAGRVKLQRLFAQNFNGYAYIQPSETTPIINNNVNQIEYFSAIDCGSGYNIQSSTFNFPTTLSNRVDAGSASTTGQTTTFDTTSLPPQAFSDMSTTVAPCYLWFNNRRHFVQSIDRALNKVTLLGWVDLRYTGGSAVWCFGGGALAMNGDSGALQLNSIDIRRSGAALWDCALYGMVVQRGIIQTSGIGWVRSRTQSSGCVGGHVNAYFEGLGEDIIDNSLEGTTNSYGLLGQQYALNFRKVKKGVIIRDAANNEQPVYGEQSSIVLSRRSRSLPKEGNPMNVLDETASIIALDMNERHFVKTIRRDTQVIALTVFDDGLNDVLGFESFSWVSMGTGGAGSAPLQVTVNVPTARTATFTANAATDEITLTAPWLKRGSRVRFTTAGTLPAPLAINTDYYYIPNMDGTGGKLATSLANAQSGINGVVIDLTDAGTGAHTLTHPITLNGGTTPLQFVNLPGPTRFVLFWRVLENDFIIAPDGLWLTTINAQVGTAYALALGDIGLVTMNNAAANVLTIPAFATVAIPVGTRIEVVQSGAGATTITGAAGVTINGTVAGSVVVGGQYAKKMAIKVATDTWLVTN